MVSKGCLATTIQAATHPDDIAIDGLHGRDAHPSGGQAEIWLGNHTLRNVFEGGHLYGILRLH